MHSLSLPLRHSWRVAPIICGIVLLLAACSSSTGTGTTQGGSSTGTSQPAPPSASATPVQAKVPTDPCALASPSDIAAVVGGSISTVVPVGGGEAQNGVKKSVCAYGTGTSSPPKVDLFYYTVVQGDPQSDFAQLKQQAPSPTAIGNLGDAAFWEYSPAKTPTDSPYGVFVLRGTLFFGVGLPGNTDQNTALSQEQQIAKLILSHL